MSDRILSKLFYEFSVYERARRIFEIRFNKRISSLRKQAKEGVEFLNKHSDDIKKQVEDFRNKQNKN